MSATIHRWIVAFGFFLAGVGATIAVPDFSPLGIPATVGVGFVFAGSIAALFANFVRSGTDPQG